MSLDLSHGFLAETQVSTRTAQQILAGNFLTRVGLFKTTLPGGPELSIWLDRPELTFVSSPDPAANVVAVELRMIARMSGRIDEARVFVAARGRIVDRTLTVEGELRACPAVNFNDSAPSDFTVTSPPNSDYDAAVVDAVKALLRSRSPFALGPLAPGAGSRIIRTYFNVEGHPEGVLVIFPVPFGQPPTPPSVTAHVGTERDAILLIPDDLVNAAIATGKAQAGLGTLPAQLNENVRANSLDIRLQNGHIRIDGSGVATTDVLGIDIDTDFNFSVFVQPLIQGGRVTINVLSAQSSFSGAVADFADFITGGAITRLMEEMLPRALDGLSLGSIQGLNFYADTVPPGDSAPASVSMIPQVFVNGLGIRYDVHTSEPALLEPPYFRGHTGSKEFHVKPCQFGDFISSRNLRRFPSREAAIRAGYDGCKTCQPEFSIASFGDLAVKVAHPADVEPGNPVKVRADYADTLVRFGVTLSPDAEEEQSGPPFDDDGVPTHFVALTRIVPAAWTVTVSCGAWSVAATVDVGARFIDAAGVLQGSRTELRATVGQPDLVPADG
jgi:hypothetical protein